VADGVRAAEGRLLDDELGVEDDEPDEYKQTEVKLDVVDEGQAEEHVGNAQPDEDSEARGKHSA